MTRFSLTLDDSVKAALFALKKMNGGEIIVPKAKSYKILDLAKAIDPKKKLIFTGKRPGEKINETLIPSIESENTYQSKNYFVIMNYRETNKIAGFSKVKNNFSYTSDKNQFLSVTQLKKIIKNQTKKND